MKIWFAVTLAVLGSLYQRIYTFRLLEIGNHFLKTELPWIKLPANNALIFCSISFQLDASESDRVRLLLAA